jgi:hypothetical protein
MLALLILATTVTAGAADPTGTAAPGAPTTAAPAASVSARSAPDAAPAAAPASERRAEPDEWADRPLIRRPMPAPAFLLPGASYASWTPIGDRERKSGGGLELSLVKWLPRSSFVFGAVGQLEYVGRTRAAVGVEVGYDVVGLEVALARDFAKADAFDAQWSLQLATYVSVGALYLAPRWIIPLHRDGGLSPGYGALLSIGFKLPIVLTEGRAASTKPAS